MRVLITTTGFSGHLLPLVPFARALSAAGHEVVAAAPYSSANAVERVGLRFAGFDDTPADERKRRMAEVATLPIRTAQRRVLADGFGRAAAGAALPRLLEIVGAWRPHLILRESMEYAGAVAGDLYGVPVVRVGLGLAAAEEESVAMAAAPVDELRARVGLPPDRRGDRMRSSPYVTLVPAELEDRAVPAPAVTYRFRARASMARPLPAWWRAGNDDPLVYVTFGSVAASLPFFPGLYREVIDSLADLPARVLVTTGSDADASELGALPPNVHVERWVDQDQIAAHVDAVVCHGGYGTVLGALTHAQPLVVVPLFAGDQWRNARRIDELGAGIALTGAAGSARPAFDPPGRDVIDAIAPAVQRLLTERRFTEKSWRIARAIERLPRVDGAPALLRALAMTHKAAAAA